jgi:hypothetical protein
MKKGPVRAPVSQRHCNNDVKKHFYSNDCGTDNNKTYIPIKMFVLLWYKERRLL